MFVWLFKGIGYVLLLLRMLPPPPPPPAAAPMQAKDLRLCDGAHPHDERPARRVEYLREETERCDDRVAPAAEEAV